MELDEDTDGLIVEGEKLTKSFTKDPENIDDSSDKVLHSESIIKPNSVLSMLDAEVLNQTKKIKKEIKKETYYRQSSTSRLIIPD